MTGTNYAAQCIGSIIVAPLIKRFPTRSVLACAVLTFGIISTIPLIADAATGGVLKFKTPNNKTKYGTWSPNGLFPIYVISGISYGTVELIRRVIPRDIVGGDVNRLRKMDAFVHVMYEVAGTTGAFTSTSLIGKMGYNYSAFLSPVLFTLALASGSGSRRSVRARRPRRSRALPASRSRTVVSSCRWWTVAAPSPRPSGTVATSSSPTAASSGSFPATPSRSTVTDTSRTVSLPSTPVVLSVFSSYSQIIVGGSNFGELLGALSVMIFTNAVPSPMPGCVSMLFCSTWSG